MIPVFSSNPLIIALFGAVLATTLIYGVRYLDAPIGVRRSLFKTLPVTLLAVISLIEGGWMLTAALLLCAAGDWFLSLDDRYFVAGLGTFLVGHILFIALFVGLSAGAMVGVIPAILIAVYAIGFASFLFKRAGRYRVPVLAYIAVISGMAVTSLGLPNGAGLATVGAFIFVISDTALALRMFVFEGLVKRTKVLSHIVWWTYIAAQLAIVVGVTSL